MTNFSFNDTVPAANNNPSADQNPMHINNVSEKAILAVDHITFGADNGGTHQQTAFEKFSVGTLPAGPTATQPSVAYPAAGVAAPTFPQYYFKNSNATFPVSLIKAWALCSGLVGGFIPAVPGTEQKNNVVSVMRNSVGYYTVKLGTNVVVGTNYAVFGQIIFNSLFIGLSSFNINITGATTFDIRLYTQITQTSPIVISDVNVFAFMVVQI